MPSHVPVTEPVEACGLFVSPGSSPVGETLKKLGIPLRDTVYVREILECLLIITLWPVAHATLVLLVVSDPAEAAPLECCHTLDTRRRTRSHQVRCLGRPDGAR